LEDGQKSLAEFQLSQILERGETRWLDPRHPLLRVIFSACFLSRCL